MPVSGATLSTLNNILKEFYLPPVQEQLNNQVLITSRLAATDEGLFGKSVYIPAHKSRSGGIGARAENATLPVAASQGYDRLAYDLTYHYGRVNVSGPSMAKTSSEAGAFLQALKSELDGIRNDLKKDVARQLYGDGSAKIVTCGASGPSTTVTLGSDEPLRKGQLYIGMIVDIGTAAAPTSIASATTITAINLATPSITIGSSVTVTSANFVFRSGNAVDATHINEMNGLKSFVPVGVDSTVGGINSATAGNEWWKSLQLSATGNAVVLADMQKAFNSVKVAGGEPSCIITSLGVQRQYFALLQSQVRYSDPLNLKSGFSTLEFMQRPLIADYEAPFGNMYFLDEQQFRFFSNRDWHFLDEDGNMLKWVPDQDTWQAVLARYMQLGAVRRNTQLVLSGITDTTGV